MTLPANLFGTALKSAYNGDLDMTYEEDGYFVRVNWRRDG